LDENAKGKIWSKGKKKWDFRLLSVFFSSKLGGIPDPEIPPPQKKIEWGGEMRIIFKDFLMPFVLLLIFRAEGAEKFFPQSSIK
jgi:hypothetical protein